MLPGPRDTNNLEDIAMQNDWRYTNRRRVEVKSMIARENGWLNLAWVEQSYKSEPIIAFGYGFHPKEKVLMRPKGWM